MSRSIISMLEVLLAFVEPTPTRILVKAEKGKFATL
jgi:hypothetical protein